jgi:hypothetical protein
METSSERDTLRFFRCVMAGRFAACTCGLAACTWPVAWRDGCGRRRVPLAPPLFKQTRGTCIAMGQGACRSTGAEAESTGEVSRGFGQTQGPRASAGEHPCDLVQSQLARGVPRHPTSPCIGDTALTWGPRHTRTPQTHQTQKASRACVDVSRVFWLPNQHGAVVRIVGLRGLPASTNTCSMAMYRAFSWEARRKGDTRAFEHGAPPV